MAHMENKKQYFIDYLKKLSLFSEGAEAKFDIYFDELKKANESLNLFSRKMDAEDIWIKHFLDSVSIFEINDDFQNKAILDFGTGGGFPGIPIQILAPESNMTLLDSTKKKIEILKKMAMEIKLNNVSFLSYRLESREMDAYKGFFDIVVCRSVKLTATLQKAISQVMKKAGKIFLYKAVKLGDVKLFNDCLMTSSDASSGKMKQVSDVKIHTLDLKLLGERRIIEINYV